MKSFFMVVSALYIGLAQAGEGLAKGALMIEKVLFTTECEITNTVCVTGRLDVCCSITNISDRTLTIRVGHKRNIVRSVSYAINGNGESFRFSHSNDIIKFDNRVLCILAPGEVYSFCFSEDKCSYNPDFIHFDVRNVCEYAGEYSSMDLLPNGEWYPEWAIVAHGVCVIDVRRLPVRNKGDIIPKEGEASGTCEIRCVCPEEKKAACSGRDRMPEDYHIYPHEVDCRRIQGRTGERHTRQSHE